MMRSTSHIGGMGVAERSSTDGPAATSTVNKEEKKLHLMIDHSRCRTYSCSPVPDGPPSAGTSISHPGFHLSQPSSPIIDDNTHPQLVRSPGCSSPIVSAGLLNRTISDESSNPTRFFMLKKDSERRHTLATFMDESKLQIIDNWQHKLVQSLSNADVVVTEHMLDLLLDGMRHFLLKKATRHIQDALDEIRCLLDYDTAKISQVNLALYSFSDSIQPVLRRLDIKPHWMFALSNLITSAVQTAISILSPDLSVLLHVEDMASLPTSSSMSVVAQRASVSRESAPSDADATESRPPSREERREDRRGELRTIQEENEQLLQRLLTVERELNHQLRAGLSRSTRLRDNAVWRHTYPPPTHPPKRNKIILPNGSLPSDVDRMNDDLVQWLESLSVDERSVGVILSEQYTKHDLLEFVTREELLNAGVGGGASCRIWRAATEARERARRLPVFLSPMRSRDDSLDDYHSSINDETYTLAES